jgi:hypothetical protein
MTTVATNLYRITQIVLTAGLLTFFLPACGFAQEDEPIAYIGHGAFFDSKGNQITLTPDFVAKALDWYRTKLMSSLNAAKKVEFANFEQRLNTNVRAEGQARLLVQHRSLEWLVENSAQLNDGGRIVGKLNALKYALKWRLPESPGLEPPQTREEFKIEPELENRLKQSSLTPGSMSLRSATVNTGQAYINECNAAGVPIPPPIGEMDPAGLTG